jgi:hypothetical protein
MPDQQFCIPYLEWEAVQFPLAITDIHFEVSDYQHFRAAQITVWRDDNDELKASLSGYTTKPQFYTDDRFTGKGNIIKGECITGITADGFQVNFTDCIFTGISVNSWEVSEAGYYIRSGINFDDIQITYQTPSTKTERQTFLYWYLCNDSDVYFDCTTYRSLKHPLKRIREGYYQPAEEKLEITGSSHSRDHVVIRADNLTCIIAQVPDVFPSTGKSGYCIEYDSETGVGLDKELLKNLEHLVGFLLGTPLFRMGHSLIHDGQINIAFLESPKFARTIPMRPIHYNRQYDWGNFGLLINKLWPVYSELQPDLKLDYAISRYWVARELPLGSNLPVIASAMELLAENYLKCTGQQKLEYLPQDQYLNFIDSTCGDLKQKLDHIEGGKIIWSKITGAYRKGPNEKMIHFFRLLKLETGKAEKNAINLRNKMAHGYRDYGEIDAAHDDLVLTRTYQVLFHRVLLKLLSYEDYYIDYSLQGSPSKSITKAAG